MAGEERILSAPKKREVLSNLAKRKGKLSKPQRKLPFLFICNRQNSDVSVDFFFLLVKNLTQINSPIVASVAVITSLGKHVFSEEFIQGNNAIGYLGYW